MATTPRVSVVDHLVHSDANLSDYELSIHKRKCISGKACEVVLKNIKENVPYDPWETPTIIYC